MRKYRFKTTNDFQEDLKVFIEILIDDLSLVGEKMDKDYFS